MDPYFPGFDPIRLFPLVVKFLPDRFYNCCLGTPFIPPGSFCLDLETILRMNELLSWNILPSRFIRQVAKPCDILIESIHET